jgi:hypothetical protein
MGPLPAFFPSCSIELLIEVPMFDRSSIQFCLFVYFFLVLLVPSTTPRSSSLGMSWKTFQAHLRSSLEALSCSKQIWPRAVILSSESQWMSMDVNGISGAETDLFDFYLPVH